MRGIISILLTGTLVLVIAAGAALAAQSRGDLGADKLGSTNAKEEGNSPNDGEKALEFEGRPTSVNGYVDLGEQGATSGDIFIFSDELYGAADSQNSSERIGQADGRCTLIDPSSKRYMCTVVTSLQNGTIVTEGVLTNAQDSPSVSSVTGGTGEYRGATGEATLELAPAEGPHAIRFDLQSNGVGSQPEGENTGQQEETQGGTEKTKAGDTKSNNTNGGSTNEAKGKTKDQ